MNTHRNLAVPVACTAARAALVESVLKARQAAHGGTGAPKSATPSNVLKAVKSAYSVPGLRAWGGRSGL